jgi:hypothetical protein
MNPHDAHTHADTVVLTLSFEDQRLGLAIHPKRQVRLGAMVCVIDDLGVRDHVPRSALDALGWADSSCKHSAAIYALRVTSRPAPRRALQGIAGLILMLAAACAPAPGPATKTADGAAAIDRDLLDVTIPQLRKLYSDKTYTVTQVVQWHLDRIDRYNGVYGAIETVLRTSALAEAKRQDDFPRKKRRQPAASTLGRAHRDQGEHLC